MLNSAPTADTSHLLDPSHPETATIIFADHCLTADGWRSNCGVVIGTGGRIRALHCDASRAQTQQLVATTQASYHHAALLLPALPNVHSHAYQRAFAGLTERRGHESQDNFWTWRAQMYALLDKLQPAHIEAITAMAQMEMLEAGFASVGEFHYLHHQPTGERHANIAELSERIMAAAEQTGIGLTLLPVLYTYAGCQRQSLATGQRRFGNDLEGFERMMQKIEEAITALPADTILGIAPHSLRAVDAAGLAYADAWSQHHQRPIHIHIAEQLAEVEEVSEVFGQRPVAWLLDQANVDARWCLVHATHMTADEIKRLAATAAVAGLCPITEANLGDGIFPGSAYQMAGGRIGMGSDSNVQISVTGELALLEYSQRLSRRARAVLAEPGGSVGHWLWTQSCRGGAQALGRGNGVIAVGEWADLVSYQAETIDALAERTPDNPFQGDQDSLLDSLIFATPHPAIDRLWSAGRCCIESGRHPHHDAIRRRYLAVLGELT